MKYVHLCTQYLVRGSFCKKAQAAWIAALSLSVLLGPVSVIFLLTTPHTLFIGFQVRQDGGPVEHSNTMVSKRFTTPGGKENQHLYIVWRC